MWLESQDGKAFVTLLAYLPDEHPHRPHHRHEVPQPHHQHPKESHFHHPPRRDLPRRPGPARLRRQEARAKARIAKLAADIQAATAENAVINSPVKNSAVQADIKVTAEQVDATPVIKAAASDVKPSEEEPAPTNHEPVQSKAHRPEQVVMNSPIPLYVWHNKRPPQTPKKKYHRGIVKPSSEPSNPIHALVIELNKRATHSLPLPSSPSSSLSRASLVSAPSSPSEPPAADGQLTSVKQLARRGGPWDVIGPEYYFMMSDSEDEDH